MKKILNLLLLLIFVSCELGDFGESFQQDPNVLTPDQADPNFVLNEIQRETADFFQDLSRTTDEVMRYTVLNESYTDVASPTALNNEYSDLYQMFQDETIITNLAETDNALLFHRGMSNILTSFSMVTMVDYLGDIPYTEAVRTEEQILNPAPDDDEFVYNAMLDRLDRAIVDLENAALPPATDQYYGNVGNFDDQKRAWIRLARSVKLKMLVNMRDTDGINTLLAEGDLITAAEDDFQFQYGTLLVDPVSNHPDFNDGYAPGGFDQFLGNSFLDLLLNHKSIRDPRLRYYVYRQSSSDPTDVLLGCVDAPLFDFCYLGDSYYGRDHGDTRARGADIVFRATFGLYPVGGTFDADNPSDPNFAFDSAHQTGGGILPILLSSFMDFLRAEAALTLGTNDDAATLLESGIRKSMDKVLSFSGSPQADSPFAATEADVEAYVTEVMGNYAAASNDRERLDIILTEYYLASYGNSTESYNGYRRTGFPSVFSAPIFDPNTPFPRLFSYPQDEVINNGQIDQQPITTQVFWDTNPPGFIN